MKLQEIKTSKFDGSGVLVPEQTRFFQLFEGSINFLICKVKINDKPSYKSIRYKIPPGQYKIIGIQTETTEEQAKEIVPCELIGGIGGVGMHWLYPDYTASMNEGFETALESFNSLMQKLEIKSDTKVLIIQKIKQI